jgi:hypothetical protein
MLHAYLVDNPRLTTPQFLKLVSFDGDTDIPARLQAAIDVHNEDNGECPAGGALVWFDDRRERLQYIAPELRLEERLGEMAKLHGAIRCASGREYKYFGQCFGWIPGSRAYWKGWLYPADKKFIFDDIRTSKDQLAKFEGELLNLPIDIVIVKALGDDALRNAIEEWDSKRELQ